MFFKGRLEYDAQGSVCEGSGARKPDSISKSIDGGRGERRRTEKHSVLAIGNSKFKIKYEVSDQ